LLSEYAPIKCNRTNHGQRNHLAVLREVTVVGSVSSRWLLPRDASSREALRPKILLTQTPDLPTVQRLAPPSHITPGLFTTEDASSVDVDMLLSSADESGAFLPSDRTRSTTSARNTGGDAASAPALLRNSTALQEELAVQMTGQRQRNVGHLSDVLAMGQGVLRVAEEKWVRTWT
ncbi:hypothetical protein EDB83DRAFT_2371692, partial [Lactarius deliciosus]